MRIFSPGASAWSSTQHLAAALAGFDAGHHAGGAGAQDDGVVLYGGHRQAHRRFLH
jgi:hypothetical protein